MTDDLDDPIRRFLAGGPAAGRPVRPIAGDASARRYWRLDGGFVLMDARQQPDGETDRFVRVGRWIRAQCLVAPEILARDGDLVLMSDLGETDCSLLLDRAPDRAPEVLAAAIDVLVRLDASPAPQGLRVLDGAAAGAALTPLDALAEGASAALGPIVAELWDLLAGPAVHVALRDVHAGNLVWRDSATGTDRVGLLDFQDAVLAPKGYDLASLLHDARRRYDADLEARLRRHFARHRSGPDAAGFAILAAQRNLRILGLFETLARSDRGARYRRYGAIVRGHLARDLAHRQLAELRAATARILHLSDVVA